MKVNSLIVIDAIGFLVTGLCAAVGLWCGVLDAGATSRSIRELSAQVQQLDENHNRLKAVLEQRHDAFEQRQAAFGARGLLPGSSSVEHELRAVSDLARANRLELTGFTPAGSKQYPGLQEVRYRMSAKGRFADYLGFLRAFQAGDSWADITFLALNSSDAQAPDATSGELTISLYSAIKEGAAEAATR